MNRAVVAVGGFQHPVASVAPICCDGAGVATRVSMIVDRIFGGLPPAGPGRRCVSRTEAAPESVTVFSPVDDLTGVCRQGRVVMLAARPHRLQDRLRAERCGVCQPLQASRFFRTLR